MGTIYAIRHAQASFGAANYDKLSDLGHRQSRELGEALKAQGVAWPEKVFVGEQTRHRETLQGVANAFGKAVEPVIHPGLNEFDFQGLLEAHRQSAALPEKTKDDRTAHFRQLKKTVLAWQRGEIENPPERFEDFVSRVQNALNAAREYESAMMFSSGGAIGQMTRLVLDAPAEQQILLQLQMKNCAVSRFVVGRGGIYLNGFNETPHINAGNAAELLTYS